MAFGKPGRPPEDQLARQRDIFAAIAPLLLECGVARLSMRRAAHAACLSIGGLYHYFPTKRDLALHALRPESLLRACDDFHAAQGRLAACDPPSYLNEYLDFLAGTAMFLRPAVWAALELGAETFQQSLTLGFGMPTVYEEFLELLDRALPDSTSRDVPALANAVRRAVVGALLDKSITAEALRAELEALIRGHRCDGVSARTRQDT